MLYPIAIEVGDENTAFGVVVPDIEGCFSAGDSYDEALQNAKEAITDHLEVLADMGELPPEATTVDQWVNNPDYQGWVWALVEVDIQPFLGKSTKFNVTLPDLINKKIDDVINTHREYKNRSYFLQIAAIHEIETVRKSGLLVEAEKSMITVEPVKELLNREVWQNQI